MTVCILTDTGIAKITAAAGTTSAVQITEVAVGDANGVAYDPTHDMTALVNETGRVAVTSQYRLSDTAWYVSAEFAPGTVEGIREEGFFDTGGDLIAILAGAGLQPRGSLGAAYLIRHTLNFAQTTGNIIIAAPDDQLIHHALIDLEGHAVLADLAACTAIELYNLKQSLEQANG